MLSSLHFLYIHVCPIDSFTVLFVSDAQYPAVSLYPNIIFENLKKDLAIIQSIW